MASTSEGFTGMVDLIRDLERMDADVQTEAAGIVQATAQLMKADVERGYAKADGDLQRGLVVEEMTRGQYARDSSGLRTLHGTLRWKVRSKALHAHLYEYGTAQRSTNSTGANRGAMPAKPTFVPAAVRARQRMHRELEGVVQRQRVKGMNGTMELRRS